MRVALSQQAFNRRFSASHLQNFRHKLFVKLNANEIAASARPILLTIVTNGCALSEWAAAKLGEGFGRRCLLG